MHDLVGYTGINKQGERFEVLEDSYIKNETRYFKVIFLETGFSRYFIKPFILKGEIRDIYYKSILNGIACIGNAKTREDGKSTLEFNLWNNMINKCYNIKNNEYKNFGAKGVTVCDRWRCFEYFLEDLPKIENYDKWKEEPSKYILDKDILQLNTPDNEKIYSLETCKFETSINITSILTNRQQEYIKNFKGIDANANSFYVRICHDNFGAFDTAESAANMYNHVARYRGYDDKDLNDVPYMTRLECINHRIERGNIKQMVYLLDKQHDTNGGKAQMITILNEDKFNSFN